MEFNRRLRTLHAFPWGFTSDHESSAKAWGLLRTRLGEKAFTLFDRTHQLMRPSKLWPGVEYLIRTRGTVVVLRDGQRVAELCVLSGRGEPEGDRLMTILDLVESDERRLWEMANLVGGPPAHVGMRPIESFWAVLILTLAGSSFVVGLWWLARMVRVWVG